MTLETFFLASRLLTSPGSVVHGTSVVPNNSSTGVSSPSRMSGGYLGPPSLQGPAVGRAGSEPGPRSERARAVRFSPVFQDTRRSTHHVSRLIWNKCSARHDV